MAELPAWQRVIDMLNSTGELPEGYGTGMILYDDIRGWTAYIRGPFGSTNWVQIKKIPKDALTRLK